ncbi:MAG: PAS domain-containing protein [Bradymonadales bacterium]|nr:PAS domain-containing protein [Bradymonadales bacterium]
MISERTLETVKTLVGALLDAYVLVDPKQKILEFNQLFYGLFPRSLARNLKKKPLDKLLEFQLGKEPVDLVAQCVTKGKPVRYEEIVGLIGSETSCKFVASAVPLFDDKQEVAGVFICLRDITDEAATLAKYRQTLEQDAREQDLLQKRIEEATTETTQLKDRLNRTEKELLDYKKGLLI